MKIIMILHYYIYRGWYHILDKTIYSFKENNHGIGPREHSFFITYLLHGINAWTISRYVFYEFFRITIGLYGGLFIAFGFFALGYFNFFKSDKMKVEISSRMSNFQIFISLTIALSYTVMSVYLMLNVGDFIREKLYPDLHP